MKATVLEFFGFPLAVKTVPEPKIRSGEIIVDIVAALVLPDAGEVFSGEHQYLLEPPVIPGTGAIGHVRTLGPDAAHLAPSDWVFCDPTARSRDNAASPDITLQCLSARGEAGLKLQRYFHDGSFAQQMRLPTENDVAIGEIDEARAAHWCALNTLLVTCGGWLAADVQAGETVLVSGATGHFGAARR